MQTKLQTWGNSLGARIPAPFAAQLHLTNNSLVEIRLEGGAIIITPARRRLTLDSLLAEITPDNRQAEEWEGGAAGKEVW